MIPFFYENKNSKFQQYYNELQVLIKNWMDDKNPLICTSRHDLDACAFSDLTYT